MKYLIATLDKPHYLWQVLVQINNFRKMGIEKDAYFIIGCFGGQVSDELMNIMVDESLECNIEVYDDVRNLDVSRKYASTLRLRILIDFFKVNPWFEKETFMYLDPDVIFTKPYDWSEFEQDDIWYVSDTKSYLDTKYIKSKSEKLFHEMCEIVGVEPSVVEENDKNAGGAQYIMKNVPVDFWEKCEEDSENLFVHMKNTEKIYNPKHPIQSWTADMWAVFWNALLYKREVKIADEMNFCWASNLKDKWEKSIIYHNAGVAKNEGKHFCKTAYQKSPFNQDITIDEKSASINYIKEIKETEKNFKHLIF